MRKIFILSVILIAGFGACQTKLDDEPPAGNISGESEVELSILTNSATRSTEFSTSDEIIIDNLDVLLFDAEKKVCLLAYYLQSERKATYDSPCRKRLRCLFFGKLSFVCRKDAAGRNSNIPI